jgi:hypothetical protein
MVVHNKGVKMVKTQSQQANQIEYDALLNLRESYRQAGFDAKVEEIDAQIKELEINGMLDENGDPKFPIITMEHIAKELGIDGLNAQLAENDRLMKENLRKFCGKLFDKRAISGAELDRLMDNKWQWSNDEKITKEIMKYLTPKLRSKVDRELYEKVFMLESRNELDISYGVKAFIKIQRLSDYNQNDNPPSAELQKIIEGNVSNLFHCLYIAYPMIKEHKQIDPIVFGTTQDPSKSYSTLDDTNGEYGFSNSELTMGRLNALNLGTMRQLGQWA